MSSGYDVKNLRVEKDKCYMDVVTCPLYDKAKALGTPETVQMICCMDKTLNFVRRIIRNIC
jgi:hypothetical protein